MNYHWTHYAVLAKNIAKHIRTGYEVDRKGVRLDAKRDNQDTHATSALNIQYGAKGSKANVHTYWGGMQEIHTFHADGSEGLFKSSGEFHSTNNEMDKDVENYMRNNLNESKQNTENNIQTESRNRRRTIRLTESKLCNIVREAVMREIGLLSESQESQVFDQAAQRLRKGESPKNIFDTIGPLENDGRRIVCLYDKDNLLNQEGNLILGTWFDDISWFEDDGYRRVWVGNKCNILNQEGNLILDKMFNNIGPIENDGCRKVSLDYKDNLLNQECQIVSGTWFDDIDWLEEDGYRRVWLNNECNLLQDGKLISDTWFDYIDDVLCDGLRTVRMNNKYNLLQDGKLISDTWFDDMTHLGTKGDILVSLNGKHYKFRVENGQIVDYRLRTNESRVRLTNILTEEVFRRFKRSLLQL